MRRLRPVMAVVGVTFGLGWFAGCRAVSARAEAKAPPPVAAPAGAGVAGTKDAPPSASAPNGTLIFDPYATRFAVVDTRPDQRSCVVNSRGWTPVASAAEGAGGTNSGASARKSEGGKLPRFLGPGLGGYCVYRWNGKDLPRREDFRAIGAVPDSTQVRTNPAAALDQFKLPKGVTRALLNIFEHQANGTTEATWTKVRKARDHRLAQLAEHLSGDEKKVLEPFLTGPSVAVAVIDATPGGPDFEDQSKHGYIVENVIANLFCPKREPACLKRIRPYLALPMKDSTQATPDVGGYFGTFSQLADALLAALNDWDPSKEHLVINLSLGWDPLKTDSGDKNETRIINLLERASCLGALIVGAAGNPTGTDGPMLPGGFEELAAPSSARCKELADKTGKPSHFPLAQIPAVQKWVTTYRRAAEAAIPGYRPLIHSVGALDARDQRLLADRRWGQPRLSALGLSVTVPVPGPAGFTPLASGTSVATSIVAGSAAAVWALRPELSAADVMSLVYAGGVELDGGEPSKRARTEFCSGEHFGPCATQSKVHRAFLCGALAAASSEPGQRPAIVCDQSVSKEKIVWPAVAAPASTSGSAPQVSIPCRIPNCGLSSGPGPSQLVAGVLPQGAFGFCPGCILTINAAGVATLEGIPSIDPTVPFVSVKIVLTTIARGTPTPFDVLPLPSFGQQMSVPMGTMPTKTSGAYLTFYRDLGGGYLPDDPLGIQVQH